MLSLAFERPPLVPPRVIVVGGVIASGKSTVADALGEALAAPVLSTDRTRKHLAGRKPTESLQSEAWSGAYTPHATEAVYSELWRRAKTVLGSRRPVVIDGSFRTRAMRDAARELAREHEVPFLMVECTAPREVCLERLRNRERGGAHESDARSALFDEFLERFEPIEELAPTEHVRLDTSRPLADNRRRLEAFVGL